MTVFSKPFEAPSVMAHKEIHENHIKIKKNLIENRSKNEWVKDFLSEDGVERLKKSSYYELFEDSVLYAFLERMAYWFEYDEKEINCVIQEENYTEMCNRQSDSEDAEYYAKRRKCV